MRPTQFSGRVTSGFTLVEIVAVLTILGLAASIVTVRFASPLRDARVRSTVEQWRATDLMARHWSREDSVNVALEVHSNQTIVRIVDSTGKTLRSLTVDSPLKLILLDRTAQPIDQLKYSARMGCPDYRLIVSEGNVMRSLDVAGGTGNVRSK